MKEPIGGQKNERVDGDRRDMNNSVESAQVWKDLATRQLLEKVPAGIYTCDADGQITYFNQRALEIWGREPLLNNPADRYSGSFRLLSTDYLPIEHHDCWMARALREKQEYIAQEIVIERPDGGRRFCLAHVNLRFDDSGNLIGAVNMLVDVTERRTMEERLRESQERFNLALYAADLGIFEHDHRTNTIFWSPTMRKLLDVDLHEPATLSKYFALIHSEDHAEIIAAVERAHSPDGDGLFRVLHRIVRRDGGVRWVNLSSRTFFDGGIDSRFPVRTIGILADVSERKQSEESLRRTAALLAEAQQVAHIGSWNWEVVHDTITWSDEHFRIFGLRPQEMEMTFDRVLRLIHPEDRATFKHEIEEACRFRRPYHCRIRAVRPDGSVRMVQCSGGVEIYDRSLAIRIYGTSQDITERIRVEEEAKAYQGRLQTLSQRLLTIQEEEHRRFARELHDEIGQNLTILRFTLEPDPNPSVADLLTRMSNARIAVESLLASVRELSVDFRPTMLDHLGLLPALLWLFDRYTARTRISVNFKHEAIDVRFESRIETAAYRFIQEAITNVARHARVNEVSVRVWVQENRLHLQVEDAGVGFNPASALAAWTSAGLTGMQERVHLLDGQLVIDSAPGVGTHLLAHIPLLPKSKG